LGLGDGIEQENSPVTIPGVSGINSISLGGNQFSLFLKADGTVLGTGFNGQGELGHGHFTNQLTPVVIPSLSEVTSISAGRGHSLFLMADKSVMATGDSTPLGRGLTTSYQNTPGAVLGMVEVSRVVASGTQSLFLKTDGNVWVAGYGNNGQLGLGTTTNQASPVFVPGMVGETQIAVRGGLDVLAFSEGRQYHVGYGVQLSGTTGYTTNTNSLPYLDASLDPRYFWSCNHLIICIEDRWDSVGDG
jgi:alpha-tubulin suppressor-like RCC1 family protein